MVEEWLAGESRRNMENIIYRCHFVGGGGVTLAQSVEALRYKSKGRGLNSRLYHRNFFVGNNPSGQIMALRSTQPLNEMSKIWSNPITGLNRPIGFQEIEAPRFQDSRHMNVIRLSALRTGRLYPGNNFWFSFLLEAVNPRAIVRPEGLCKWKIPVTPSGIEPATFRRVAQSLIQLCHRLPQQTWIPGIFTGGGCWVKETGA
jgi:hypothetical protein